MRLIPGMEEARIIRPGYAIEYDFVDPRELGPICKQHESQASSMPVRSTERQATRRRLVRD